MGEIVRARLCYDCASTHVHVAEHTFQAFSLLLYLASCRLVLLESSHVCRSNGCMAERYAAGARSAHCRHAEGPFFGAASWPGNMAHALDGSQASTLRTDAL